MGSLIAEGVLAEFPTLRVCATHGAGSLGLLLPRLDRMWSMDPSFQERLPERPSAYARRIFVDLLVFAPHALDFVLAMVGDDQVVVGSDYPFMPDAPGAVLDELASLTTHNVTASGRSTRCAFSIVSLTSPVRSREQPKGNRMYKVIDGDGHIFEWEQTFADEFLDEEYRHRRPVVVDGPQQLLWAVDNVTYPGLYGDRLSFGGSPVSRAGIRRDSIVPKPESLGVLEIRDADERIQLHKAEGIDIAVIYPTLLLIRPLSYDLGFEAALCKSYNSWMAHVCSPDPTSSSGWLSST